MKRPHTYLPSSLRSRLSPRPQERAEVKDAGRRATRAHEHARTRELRRKITGRMSAPEREQRTCARYLREPGLRLRTPRLVVSCAALTLLMTLSTAVSAQARFDPIAGGQTRLTLAGSFSALLKANGVKLKATDGAVFKAGIATFPVSGGKLEPVDVVGSVEHEGALISQVGAHRPPVKGLVLKSTRRR